jgi:hypothetical protein
VSICGACKFFGQPTAPDNVWHHCEKGGIAKGDYPKCRGFEPNTQPAPRPNGLPRVHDLVLTDLEGRLAQGLRTYGVPLQPHNGRDALRDAYEEAIDLAFYLRQAIFERDGK